MLRVMKSGSKDDNFIKEMLSLDL